MHARREMNGGPRELQDNLLKRLPRIRDANLSGSNFLREVAGHENGRGLRSVQKRFVSGIREEANLTCRGFEKGSGARNGKHGIADELAPDRGREFLQGNVNDIRAAEKSWSGGR